MAISLSYLIASYDHFPHRARPTVSAPASAQWQVGSIKSLINITRYLSASYSYKWCICLQTINMSSVNTAQSWNPLPVVSPEPSSSKRAGGQHSTLPHSEQKRGPTKVKLLLPQQVIGLVRAGRTRHRADSSVTTGGRKPVERRRALGRNDETRRCLVLHNKKQRTLLNG